MFFLTAHVRYIKILTWLRGFRVKIAVSIVSKFLKATWAQRKENQTKFRKMARNPQSHVRILIYRTWAIVLFDAFWYVNSSISSRCSWNEPALFPGTDSLFSGKTERVTEIPGSRVHAILLGFSNSKAYFSLVAWTKDDANKEMCYVQARLKLKIFEYCGIKRKGPLTLIVLKDLAKRSI